MMITVLLDLFIFRVIRGGYAVCVWAWHEEACVGMCFVA